MAYARGAARLGRDPEFKLVGDNEPVCELNVIMLKYRKDKSDPDNRVDKGFWVQVNVWGMFAENVSKRFVKGDKVFIVDLNLYQDTFIPEGKDDEVSVMRGDCNLVFAWTPDLESLNYKPRQQSQNNAPGTG